jgi:hypothetical protein
MHTDTLPPIHTDPHSPGSSPCGGCGLVFASLDDLFSHACDGSRPVQRHAGLTRPSDTPDRTRPQGNGTGSARRPHGASAAQMRYLRQLLDQLGIEDDLTGSGITTVQASGLIDSLKERLAERQAERQADQRPAAEQLADARQRRNKYAGPCHLCGNTVPAQAGSLTRGAAGWLIAHMGGCPTPAPASPEPVTAPASGSAPYSDAPVPAVPAGHYAIASTGDNDLAFYRVDRPAEGDYAGQVFVKLVVGGHPDRNVRRAAVPGILARIADDGPEAAARRYGQEIGRCCRCNRELTDQDSRAAGIGPECAKAGA